MRQCHYHDYYIDQVGTGVGAIYRGTISQKGHGFGSFLKGLFRSVMPLLKSGLKTVGKEAVRSGSYFINDVVNDVPVKDAFKTRMSESVQNLKRKAEDRIDNLSGAGVVIKRRRTRIKNQKLFSSSGAKSSCKTKCNKSSDIFG